MITLGASGGNTENPIIDMGYLGFVKDKRPDITQRFLSVLSENGISDARAVTEINDAEYLQRWLYPEHIPGFNTFHPETPGVRFAVWVTWNDFYLWTGKWIPLEVVDTKPDFLQNEAADIARFLKKLDMRAQK